MGGSLMGESGMSVPLFTVARIAMAHRRGTVDVQ